MADFSKKIINDEGKEETVIVTDDDNLKVNLNSNYTLANRSEFKKESKLVKKFKGSMLGADIGVKSGGFSSIAILATVIAIAVLVVMYFIWRF